MRLPARSPTQAAGRLCEWLEALRRSDAGLFDWLLDLWLWRSEREFERIRLTPDEQARWQVLPQTDSVVAILERKVFKRADRADRIETYGRIRCRDGACKYIRRDVQPLRWVMAWACALRA